jgi:putative oxidoreductase
MLFEALNQEVSMATHVLTQPFAKHHVSPQVMRYAVPVGRVLFSLIFMMSAATHFSAKTIDYAASAGVPFASIAVPAAGLLALIGGLSVALGYHARFGALLLIVFLIPVTLMMHRFWGLSDPQATMVQRVMFLKNVSMLGTTLLLAYFGAGPVSIDARQGRDVPSM